MSSPEPNVVVLYHGQNCTDGWGAALIAFLIFGYNAIFKAMSHGDNPPDVEGKRVYILDYCFSKEIIEKMIEDAESVLVIDHHKTAEKELCDISDNNKIFNMKKSGAVLTWEHFYPNEPVPELLLYIQDRDIWINKMNDTREVAVALQDMNKGIEHVDQWIYYLDDSKIPELVNKGLSVLEHQKKILEKLEKSSYLDTWNIFVDGESKVFKVAVSNSPTLQSDLGARLLTESQKFKSADFAAIYYYNGTKTIFSLRSCDHKQDISIIAKLFGGGGHRNASGCAVEGFTNKLNFSRIDNLKMKLQLRRQAWRLRCPSRRLRWPTCRLRWPTRPLRLQTQHLSSHVRRLRWPTLRLSSRTP
jgi:oligoribonuclease NrnB/cAMP/cGMP phosphodiesterase (DHH superfamily)